MSLIERFRGSPPKPAAPDIARKLQEAETQLPVLEAQHAQDALDSVTGIDGAGARLSATVEKIERLRERILTLCAAHKAAVERDAAEDRSCRAALQKTQIAAVRSHLAARDAAAEAFSAAQAEACKQFKIMQERSAKAVAACPVGFEWPGGSMCTFGDLSRAVAQEMYRLGGDPMPPHKKSFPGAKLDFPLKANLKGEPHKVPPLADSLKEASARVIRVLTGRVAG